MVKKCLYCSKELSKESVVDFCENCGISVFGEKMFKVIVENINQAKKRGDID